MSVLFWTFLTLLFSDSSHFWPFRFPFLLIFPSSFRFLPSNTLYFPFSAFCHASFPFPYLSVLLLFFYDFIVLWYLPSPSFSDSFSPVLVLSIFTSSYPHFLSPFRPASSDLWTSVPCFWIFPLRIPKWFLATPTRAYLLDCWFLDTTSPPAIQSVDCRVWGQYLFRSAGSICSLWCIRIYG